MFSNRLGGGVTEVDRERVFLLIVNPSEKLTLQQASASAYRL